QNGAVLTGPPSPVPGRLDAISPGHLDAIDPRDPGRRERPRSSPRTEPPAGSARREGPVQLAAERRIGGRPPRPPRSPAVEPHPDHPIAAPAHPPALLQPRP